MDFSLNFGVPRNIKDLKFCDHIKPTMFRNRPNFSTILEIKKWIKKSFSDKKTVNSQILEKFGFRSCSSSSSSSECAPVCGQPEMVCKYQTSYRAVPYTCEVPATKTVMVDKEVCTYTYKTVNKTVPCKKEVQVKEEVPCKKTIMQKCEVPSYQIKTVKETVPCTKRVLKWVEEPSTKEVCKQIKVPCTKTVMKPVEVCSTKTVCRTKLVDSCKTVQERVKVPCTKTVQVPKTVNCTKTVTKYKQVPYNKPVWVPNDCGRSRSCSGSSR